jgi:hypothetical protein
MLVLIVLVLVAERSESRYNHERTDLSVLLLLYGLRPRLPIDAMLTLIATCNPAAIERAHRMTKALDFAREHLEKAQQRQIRNADRRGALFSVMGEMLLES